MHHSRIRNLSVLSVLGLALAGAVSAADTQTTPAQNAQVDDFMLGKKAIDAKNWSAAANHFSKVVAQDPKNADGYNYLGYSSRWMGNYAAAFAAYDKAHALDPLAQRRTELLRHRVCQIRPAGPGQNAVGEAAIGLRCLQ